MGVCFNLVRPSQKFIYYPSNISKNFFKTSIEASKTNILLNLHRFHSLGIKQTSFRSSYYSTLFKNKPVALSEVNNVLPHSTRPQITINYKENHTMRKIETLADLKSHFVKKLANQHISACPYGGPQPYLKPNMTEFAEQAYKNKQEYFYCDPIDPDNPNGPQKLCKPKYEYDLIRPLTEEEYNNIFSECNEK